MGQQPFLTIYVKPQGTLGTCVLGRIMLVVSLLSGGITHRLFSGALSILFEYKSPGKRNIFRGFYCWKLIHWPAGFEEGGYT